MAALPDVSGISSGMQGAQIGVNVISAAAQWVNSSNADKASKAEREKMQDVIDKLQSPNFDPSNFTSEEYAVAAKYVPQVASFIEEKAPQLVKATADGQAGREAQLNALSRMRNLSETGEDLQSQVMRQKALGEAAQQNQGQQATIQQNARQRGLGGSGLEFMNAMAAQQGSAQTAARTGQDAALAAYQTRLDAMKNGASLGGQVRDQDMTEQARNAGIINDYNQRKTEQANRYQQYAAGQNNAAQQFNIGQQQGVANANVGLKNADKARAQQRGDMIANAKYGFQNDQANRQLGQYQGDSNAIQDRANHMNQAVQGVQQGINAGMDKSSQNAYQDQQTAFQKQKYDSLYGPQASAKKNYNPNANFAGPDSNGLDEYGNYT